MDNIDISKKNIIEKNDIIKGISTPNGVGIWWTIKPYLPFTITSYKGKRGINYNLINTTTANTTTLFYRRINVSFNQKITKSDDGIVIRAQ